jgi:hypothetical protein
VLQLLWLSTPSANVPQIMPVVFLFFSKNLGDDIVMETSHFTEGFINSKGIFFGA